MKAIINDALEENEKDMEKDAYSKVMGKDKYGRARLFGLNVNPANVQGVMPSRAASYRIAMQEKSKVTLLEQRVDQEKSKVALLEQRVDQLTALVMQGNSSGGTSLSTSLPSPNFIPSVDERTTMPSIERHTPTLNSEPRPLKV